MLVRIKMALGWVTAVFCGLETLEEMRSFGFTPDLDLFLEAFCSKNSSDVKTIGEAKVVSVLGNLECWCCSSGLGCRTEGGMKR